MLGPLSIWSIGIGQGYMKDQGLPWHYKYVPIAMGSVLHLVSNIRELPGNTKGLAMVCVGVPIFMGSLFCMGTYVGKSARFIYGCSR